MPTFSRNLEQSLHRALALANERHHEYATLEHLLLALIDDQDAAPLLRACNVKLATLRPTLTPYLETDHNSARDNSQPRHRSRMRLRPAPRTSAKGASA